MFYGQSYYTKKYNVVQSISALNLNKTKKYALTGQYGIMYSYVIWDYFNLKSVYPVNLGENKDIDFSSGISRQIIDMEGKEVIEDAQVLKFLLQRQNVSNVIYTKFLTNYLYNDRNGTLFKVLQDSCKLLEYKNYKANYTENYVFEDCSFY